MGYPIWFEVKRDGATPGKRVMGIRVVQRNGAPVGWGPSVLRNLLRTADFLPVGYGFGLLSILFSGSFRRLGDLAAGTVVIRSQVVAPALRGRDVPPTPPAATLEILSNVRSSTSLSVCRACLRRVLVSLRRLPRLSCNQSPDRQGMGVVQCGGLAARQAAGSDRPSLEGSPMNQATFREKGEPT